jgi:CHAD domain-containing protein
MRPPTKWLTVDNIQAPAARVARTGLMVRLRWVWQMLTQFVKQEIDPVLAVHQLRVAARRAGTSVQELSPLFAKHELHWLKKQLKKIRQAAGTARDADVLLLSYAQVNDDQRPPRKALRQLKKIAAEARSELLKRYAKLKQRNFTRHCKQLLVSARPLREVRGLCFADYARQALERDWTSFCSVANQDLSQIEKLHEFRLIVKRIRYSCELFRNGLPAVNFDPFYDRLAALQEALGQINDHATATVLWQSLAAKLNSKKVSGWLATELPRRKESLSSAHADFLARWPQLWNDLQHEAQQLLTLDPAVSEPDARPSNAAISI